MKLRLYLVLVILISSNFLFAQTEFSGSMNLEGYYSSKEDLPFWFYSNQRGRVSEKTNFDGWMTGRLDYNLSEEVSFIFSIFIFHLPDIISSSR